MQRFENDQKLNVTTGARQNLFFSSKKFDHPYTMICRREESTGKILHTPIFLSPRFYLSHGDTPF